MKKKILCVMLSTAMVAALLAGCTKTKPVETKTSETSEIVSEIESEVVVEDESEIVDEESSLANFVGTWADPNGRASMTIVPNGDNEGEFLVEVTWGSSAWEVTIWTMTAVYDQVDGNLIYNDCVKVDRTYSDDETYTDAEKYVDGSGVINFTDEGLTWESDDEEDEAVSMVKVDIEIDEDAEEVSEDTEVVEEEPVENAEDGETTTDNTAK